MDYAQYHYNPLGNQDHRNYTPPHGTIISKHQWTSNSKSIEQITRQPPQCKHQSQSNNNSNKQNTKCTQPDATIYKVPIRRLSKKQNASTSVQKSIKIQYQFNQTKTKGNRLDEKTIKNSMPLQPEHTKCTQLCAKQNKKINANSMDKRNNTKQNKTLREKNARTDRTKNNQVEPTTSHSCK